MSELNNFFNTLKDWERDQEDITKWKQFQANSDNVEEFAHKHLNQDPEGRNDDGSMTAEKILCSSCVSISDAYRFDEDTTHLEYISEAMNKYITSAPVILYRGVSDIPMKAMEEAAAKLHECTVDFYEKGYMSCSLLKEEASPYKTQLVIYVPPMNHVMYAGHCNDEEEDHCRQECIIKHGAKLKILKRENDTYYCLLTGTE